LVVSSSAGRSQPSHRDSKLTVADIEVGRSTRVSKTVSESDVYLFAGITGDFSGNHVDEEYCRKTSFGHRIAHGALIVGYMSAASTKILDDFPVPMVSVGYDRIRFLRPVLFGDTVTIDYVITELQPERQRILSDVKVTNQTGTLVAVARHIMQLVD
jgi:3-hydroxybutyryl-CoA dehydratase